MFFMSVEIHIAVLWALRPCTVICSMWVQFCMNLLPSSSGSTHMMDDIPYVSAKRCYSSAY